MISVNILTWNTIDTLKQTLEILKNDLQEEEHEIERADGVQRVQSHDAFEMRLSYGVIAGFLVIPGQQVPG